DGDVIGEEIGAGEVEVDDSGQASALKEDVVREQICVDHPFREVGRPRRFHYVQLTGNLASETDPDIVGVVGAVFVQLAPSCHGEVIRPSHGKAFASDVHASEGRADLGTVLGH